MSVIVVMGLCAVTALSGYLMSRDDGPARVVGLAVSYLAGFVTGIISVWGFLTNG